MRFHASTSEANPGTRLADLLSAAHASRSTGNTAPSAAFIIWRPTSRWSGSEARRFLRSDTSLGGIYAQAQEFSRPDSSTVQRLVAKERAAQQLYRRTTSEFCARAS